eukprot:9707088-Alexandrium_andersonii.AAC.1
MCIRDSLFAERAQCLRAAAGADAAESGEAVPALGRGSTGSPAVREACRLPAPGADSEPVSSSAVAR